MSSRTATYRRAAGVRLRPVPEMEFCLVFTARNPNIYTLNVASWLIVELCDGRPWPAVTAAYADAFAPHLSRGEALRQLRAGLKDLVSKEVLVRAGGPARAVRAVPTRGDTCHERRQSA